MAASPPEPSPDPVPRWLPSPALLLVGVMAVIFSLTVSFHGLTDPDYFWHITTGRLIVTHLAVPTTDPYSFTYAGGAWTPHEWLGEVLIYLSISTLGSALTLFAFGLLGGATIGVGVIAARRRGIRMAPIALAAVVSGVVLASYLTVRPQAFSWLLLAVLVALLASLDGHRPRRVLWLVPFFALWANLHGLYVVGLGVVFLWMVASLLGWTPMSGARRWAMAGALGALLASMLTPAGPIGILYPFRYLQPNGWGFNHIQEWLSPNFHDPSSLGLLLLIGVLLLVGARGSPVWLNATIAILVLISLVSLRNAPLAAMAAFPALALSFDGIVPRRPARVRRASTARIRRFMEIGLAAIVVAAAALIFGPRILPDRAAAIREHLPVAGVDRLLELHPDAHVLAEYGWGGYVISRIYDRGGRVFIDGRNDMYPEQTLEDYSAIRDTTGDWLTKLKASGTDAILLPPGANLVSAAPRAGGWCEKFRDDVQVLLLRCSSG